MGVEDDIAPAALLLNPVYTNNYMPHLLMQRDQTCLRLICAF
jgi:hypothetical protein